MALNTIHQPKAIDVINNVVFAYGEVYLIQQYLINLSVTYGRSVVSSAIIQIRHVGRGNAPKNSLDIILTMPTDWIFAVFLK